jgi:hypothetical protein
MSNPIDPTPEPVESAAQYRVSAQELSHVVSILQARKEAEARQRANTVALGEAVEQLGLDMTPDELLAEIQSDRARRSGGSRPNRQNNAQRHTFATFAICAGLAGMMVCSIHAHRLNRAMWENRHSPFSLPREYDAYSVSRAYRSPMAEVTPDIAPAMIDVTTTAPAPFRPFAQFEDNERADIDFQSLRDLANGKSGAEVLVQPNGTEEDKLWTVVKHDGEVLVFAYATFDETAKALNGHAAHVYASEQEGTQVQLLPLRLFQNAELVDIPGQSGANLNAPGTPQQQQPTPWAYRAVTVEVPKDRFPSESLPSMRVWRGYSPDSERAK